MNNRELYHYGVKGQKWGERRYQNADGSLTSEGRAHYGYSNGSGSSGGSGKLYGAAKKAHNKKVAKRVGKALGVAAGVAGTAALGYAAYKNRAKIGQGIANARVAGRIYGGIAKDKFNSSRFGQAAKSAYGKASGAAKSAYGKAADAIRSNRTYQGLKSAGQGLAYNMRMNGRQGPSGLSVARQKAYNAGQAAKSAYGKASSAAKSAYGKASSAAKSAYGKASGAASKYMNSTSRANQQISDYYRMKQASTSDSKTYAQSQALADKYGMTRAQKLGSVANKARTSYLMGQAKASGAYAKASGAAKSAYGKASSAAKSAYGKASGAAKSAYSRYKSSRKSKSRALVVR